MIAEVLIEYSVKSLDKTFDYLVPFNLEKKLSVGNKVRVPFGKSYVEGFVLRIKNEFDDKVKYKNIICIVNEEFILNEELLKLGVFIKNSTYCNLISAYSCMLPKALKAKDKVNINKKYISYLLVCDNILIKEYITKYKRNVGEIKILKDLLNKKKVLKTNYSLSSVKNLVNKGIIYEVKDEVNRLSFNSSKKINVSLTTEQEKVFESINNSHGNNVFLIHGVTGSGKTEIYIKLIKSIIKNNKSCILLVPEISLTPQIVSRFVSEFSSNVAVLHSKLSEGEKYDEYRRILNDEVNVVIGARSAIFAPLKNIGLIIIDEEQSSSYKQESTPKYNAIDIAKKRCEYNNCNLVLGSATPSLESYARAKKGVYKLLKLNNRINNIKMPNINLIDMNNEIKKRNFIISDELNNKIIDRLNKHEQVILLLNRRGYNTYVSCNNCGYVYKCPNCDISLTFHKSSNAMRCHYCGYSKVFNEICPNCNESNLKTVGLGTEKLESIIKEKYKAKVLRMDFDSTSKKGAHEKIINSFKNEEYDILVGTQMISKGLNFPNVTLVGIINADAVLNIPDFRSSEHAFELYSQTSGRSGRSNKQGEVCIQTFNPDNKILNYVKNNDYDGFYNYEMNIRKKLKYPPYYYLTNIKIISSDYTIASKEANKVLLFLKNKLDETHIILGPTTASMFKMNNKYHFSILIKYKSDKILNRVLLELNEIYKSNNVVVDINNNPLSLI